MFGIEQDQLETSTMVEVSQELADQLAFLREIDALKSVQRRSQLMNGSRRENSAEHSWHVAMAAVVLAQYANEPVELSRVIMMLLVHDIVEIDAGDTYAYDAGGLTTQAEREEQAASRLFGLLPDGQRDELMALWHEFEANETAEAKFALTLDRLLPVLHNYAEEGGTWRGHHVDRKMVSKRMAPMQAGSETLWHYVEALLDEAVGLGYLNP